jgi:transposase
MGDGPMMGRQRGDQAQFFYSFRLEERVPASHLLRKINIFVGAALADVHREMAAFYSHTGRPSIDPELMMRMLIFSYCYGIRSERKPCEEVAAFPRYIQRMLETSIFLVGGDAR